MGERSDFVAAFRQMDLSLKWWLSLSYGCKLRIIFCRQVQKEVLCVRSNFIMKATSRGQDTILIAIEMEHVAGLRVTGKHSRRFYHIFFMFSFWALFSFWRNPNLDTTISVFQRGSSSSIICLSLLLGQFSLKKEGLVFGLRILKEESHTCCLGPFLFQDWRCSLNKANNSRKVVHCSICMMSHMLSGYVAAFRIIILMQRLVLWYSFSNVKSLPEFSDFK